MSKKSEIMPEIISIKTVIKGAKTLFNYMKKSVLTEDCASIMNDYELYYCKDREDFWEKYERVPNEKKTIIMKVYPDLYELVEQHYQSRSSS